MNYSANASKRAITIVIPFHNQTGYLEQCLRSIAATEIRSYTARLLLVDNASAERLNPRLLDELGLDCTIIRNGANQAVSQPWNRGIRIAMESHGAAAVCLLNSDVILGPRWIDHCLKALDQGTYCAFPFNYTFHGATPADFLARARLASAGDLRGAYRDIKLKRDHRPKSKYYEEGLWDLDVKPVEMHATDGFSGFCFWLSRKCIEDIGYIDERMSLLFSDTDYRNRLIAAGNPPVCVHTCMAHHFGSMTFRAFAQCSEHAAILRADRKHFERKWPTPHDRVWRAHCIGRLVTQPSATGLPG